MASLDVIRTLTLRAKAEGFAQAEGAATSLGTSVETSARRQLSMERSLATLERRFISSSKATQDFEKVQRQLAMVTSQFPQAQERANAVLDAAAAKLSQTGGAAINMTHAMSESVIASRTLVAGMTAAGKAANDLATSVERAAAASVAASRLIIAGMSELGKAALESSVATEKLTAGMSSAGRQAANLNVELVQVTKSAQSMTAAMSMIGKAALDSSVATQKLVAGMSAVGKEAAAPKQLDAVAAGMSSATNSSRLLIEGMSAYGTRTTEVARRTDQWSSSTKASRFELLNLSRQLQDVGVGIASGQRFFTILIQQGSQIFDVFQSASLSGRSLGREILALITPFRVLATVIIASVAGSALLLKSLADMEVKLVSLSERVDTPIDKLRSLQSVAAGFQISPGEFEKAMEGFGDQVDRAKLGLGDLAELFRRNGKTVGDLDSSLEKVADLVQNAATGAQRFRIVQEAGLPPSAELVRLLSQGGANLKAQVEDAKRYNSANEQLGKQAREFNEAWSKAWDNFKRNAQDAALATFSFFGKLADKAGEFIQSNQMRVLRLRGFSDEQAQRNLGQGALGSGVGTRLEQQEANNFYNNIRGAGEKIAKDRSQTNRDAKELAALDSRRFQLLGNLATTEDAIAQKRRELNEAAISGVRIQEDEYKTLLKIAELEDISRKSSARVSALGEAATEAERYFVAVDRLKVALADTTINQQEFNRALIGVHPAFRDVQQFSSTLGHDLTASLADVATGAKTAGEAFKDFGNVVLRALTEIIIKLTLTKQLEESLSLALGGTVSKALPVTAPAVVGGGASGGIIGGDALTPTLVDLRSFFGAPRFASGGIVGGGVPVVAHRGEGIFTPAQMAAMGGGNQIVNVNVTDNAGVKTGVSQSKGQNGELNVDVVLDQLEGRLADNMRRGKGPLVGATSGRFGLQASRGNTIGG